MPKGNHHNNRGRGDNGRRGRGNYRGSGSFQGGSSRGRHHYPHANDQFDTVIQVWNEDEPVAFRSRGAGGGGGKWGGGPSGGRTSRSGAGTPRRGTDSPRRGNGTPGGGRTGRGRGQYSSPRTHPGFGANRGGRGGPPKALGRDAPLSNLLYSERPLLRPVIFVRATLTPFLFQESEELLKPVSEDAGTTEESHVPTAERVARVFNGGNDLDPIPDDGASTSGELEEVDFADLGKIRAEVDAVVSNGDWKERPSDTTVETFTGIYGVNKAANVIDSDPHHNTQQDKQAAIDLTLDALGKSIDALDVSTSEATEVSQNTLIIEEETPSPPIEHEDVSIETIPTSSPSQGVTNAAESLHVTGEAVVIPAPVDAPSDNCPTMGVSPDLGPPLQSSSTTTDTGPTEDVPLFVIDTEPTKPPHRSASDVILVDRTGGGETLGQEDELIVYVAPHPRSGRESPEDKIPRVKLPTTSILTGRSLPTTESSIVIDDKQIGGEAIPFVPADEKRTEPQPPRFSSLSLDLTPTAATKQPRQRPAFTPSERAKSKLKALTKEKRVRRRRQDQHRAFGSFGAILSEARLREEDQRERRHPKWETRRKDDSDIDWGDEDEENDRGVGNGVVDEIDVDEISNGLGGMDLDPDVGADMKAMQGFLRSMSAEGSKFVTMDDIEDEERMHQEDEDVTSEDSSDTGDSDSEEDSDEEAILELEEKILIAESEGEGPVDDSDDEGMSDSDEEVDGLSPKASFQARLRKVREKSSDKLPNALEIAEDDDDMDDDFAPRTRGGDDEEFLAHIDTLLEENTTILTGRDRKQRKNLFRNLHQGYVDDYDDIDDVSDFVLPAKRRKGKKNRGADLPLELKAQWEKDRAKKAEYKRRRAEARIEAALDPFSEKKGGKKGRKAMKAAAKLDPDIRARYPNAIVDIPSLEKQIRAFVQDMASKPTMALPPMDKASRKTVHELAQAFGLKSQSKGGGMGRYTTLIKKKAGVIKEKKVQSVLKSVGGGFDRPGGNETKPRMPKHRDGDEVGKEAPKIGESNIGFKMLASMGWTEGVKIGGDASVGIEAPLTAIIKNSKLGLGAIR